MMKSSSKLAILGIAALAAGCASQQEARLYSMKDGRTSALVVQDANASKGTVSGALPSGESCTGDFTTVAANDAPKLTDSTVAIGENAETSVAMLTCGSGVLLKCTLARRPGEGFRYGACRDQQGAEYNVIF